MGKFRFGRNKSYETHEGFVWITFSDLLTTLFLVFMVIALWAISNRDAQKKKGEQCLEDLNATRENQIQTKEALASLSHEIIAEFELLQKSGICNEASIVEKPGTGGFQIYQKEGAKPWFDDGHSTLSEEAKVCLKSMGDVWIRLINSNTTVSAKLKHVLIEGHANSNPYPNMSEEENFLRNLSLSQDRALQAARFLIGAVTDLIHRGEVETKLREVMIAQGKSYLEPVRFESGSEDMERSKRLEFKLVLESKTDAN